MMNKKQHIVMVERLIGNTVVACPITQEDLEKEFKQERDKVQKGKLPGYVYFIGNDKIVKIGKSNNPENRLLELQTGNHTNLSILAKIYCNTQKEAFTLENSLHLKYKNQRTIGEWFTNTKELQSEWNQLTTKDR